MLCMAMPPSILGDVGKKKIGVKKKSPHQKYMSGNIPVDTNEIYLEYF